MPERVSPEGRERPVSPSPLDEKRLQFFDDAASDQVPFDQVWNQQEFALDEKNSDDGTDDQNHEEKEGELDQSMRSEVSKPFDEDLQEDSKIGTAGSSAFSAFSAASCPDVTSFSLCPFLCLWPCRWW